MRTRRFHICLDGTIKIFIMFAVIILSIVLVEAELAVNIIPKEEAQSLIAKLVPPISEEDKKIFWEDGKRTMDNYFAELREASGGKNEDVVLQLMYFSLHSTSMEQGMTADFVIEQMKISKAEIATALLPFIETDNKALHEKSYNWLIISPQKEILPAQVILKPEALEVSPGILTAFVHLPQEFPVKNITSATCDGARFERMMLNDDQTQMIIKFRRQDIEAALAQLGESIDTNFVVRGTWWDAAETRLFQGTDSITKIVGAEGKKK